MSFPVLLFLALLGTATLGFISAWFLQNEKMKALKEENAQLLTELSELQTRHEELARECEINSLTVENLQLLLLDYEQKVFDLQRKLIDPKPASNGKATRSSESHISLPNLVEKESQQDHHRAEKPLVKVLKTPPKTVGEVDNKLIDAFKKGVAKERETHNS